MFNKFSKYYIARFLGFVVWFELIIQIPLNSALAYYLSRCEGVGVDKIFLMSGALGFLLYFLCVYIALNRVFFKSYDCFKLIPNFSKLPLKLFISTVLRLFIPSVFSAIYIWGMLLYFDIFLFTRYFLSFGIVLFCFIALIIHGYIIQKIVKKHAKIVCENSIL